MGLKTRLIIAFLSIVILPIITAFGVISFFSYQLDQLNEEQNEEIDDVLSDINDVIIDNYQHLDDPELFFHQIGSIIEPYNVEIIITAQDNDVLIDSSEIEESNEEDFMFTMRQSQVQTLDGDIINIEIKSNSLDLTSNQSYNKIITTIIVSIGSGLLVLIALMIGWTLYISRTILNPLKQIYTATEEMTEGNLNYEINYTKNDEIGRFIKGFNIMRDHLKQSLHKQQQYEKNRKELIATISHDLRTPLQSIKGYVEGINDGIVQNEEMKKRYLQVILSKTEQLNRLIEDLFEFSKIDLDQLAMEKVLVNSKDYFDQLLTEFAIDLNQKETKLLVKKSVPSSVIHIDKKRIEQVFTNLLDNAVRYGASEIGIRMYESTEEKRLVIVISDNGPGIPEEDLSHIFNHFYRGEKSRSRELGGTGLGLAIVKSILEAHDGEITVESVEGNGTTFKLSLPTMTS
ncbi:sensor histidine kinase [Salipaludibacillus daqingensis]|uniref:sensor histidine kinase n=1 Tax=Salipaludibacillus daqingensis TaxID=3041001 RepID=UPI002476F752|nr:ATP-binding protein [Salipaludibacillus daqingensis]